MLNEGKVAVYYQLGFWFLALAAALSFWRIFPEAGPLWALGFVGGLCTFLWKKRGLLLAWGLLAALVIALPFFVAVNEWLLGLAAAIGVSWWLLFLGRQEGASQLGLVEEQLLRAEGLCAELDKTLKGMKLKEEGLQQELFSLRQSQEDRPQDYFQLESDFLSYQREMDEQRVKALEEDLGLVTHLKQMEEEIAKWQGEVDFLHTCLTEVFVQKKPRKKAKVVDEGFFPSLLEEKISKLTNLSQ